MEAALERFQAANTQVLGVSVDSLYSHAAWAASLGGVSFPLLADFHPKGALASELGLYLDGAGISDRATVIIDRDGVIQYIAAVGPAGQRDIDELVAACEQVHGDGAAPSDFQAGPGLSSDSVLYLRNNCGASRSALWACQNLHVADSLTIKNVSEDAAALAELEKLSGGKQAPCLVVGGEAKLEAAAIVSYLVENCGTRTD